MVYTQCTNCREHKPLSEFPTRKRKSIDKTWWCNSCKRQHMDEIRENEAAYLDKFNLSQGRSRGWINGVMACLSPRDY